MQNIPFHPLADVFPLIHGQEFVELKQDIKAHGVREPIWLLDGQILDGRNRFRAAQEVGVTPEYKNYEGDDPLSFVVSLNLHRRHLTESQRAMVAGKLANMRQGARTDVQPSANLREVSQSQAAEMFQVSERSVNTAKAIQRDGDESLKQAVTDGEASLNAAADVATLPKDEQKEIVAKGREEILKAAKGIRQKEKLTMMNSSETPEHYSPKEFMEVVMEFMGEIDTDPCSNSKESPNVPAKICYTKDDDGLAQKWEGKVYMNPPYGNGINDWAEKLVAEYQAGHCSEAIALMPARTDTRWFSVFRDSACCFIKGRLKFIGNSDPAPFPSAAIYLGKNKDRFVKSFSEIGDIWERVND